ncbi:MAG: flagellar hook-basal body complex protein FliE [Campylobacterota bacterium]|nr:flagellar hook-basal body complex protein FliE [Campylobacterota bacterium]
MENINALSTADLLANKSNTLSQGGGEQFAQTLKSAMEDVNSMQVKSEDALSDLATGQIKDLHQAALSIGKAETSMKLMLEVRNKALNAYKEITRTQM